MSLEDLKQDNAVSGNIVTIGRSKSSPELCFSSGGAASRPINYGVSGLADDQRTSRSLFYVPHTMEPCVCCLEGCRNATTTTVMCLEHYPRLVEASNVHMAIHETKKLYRVVCAMLEDAGVLEAGEVCKAMCYLFDYVWFNRANLLEYDVDVVTMRRLYVEYVEILARLGRCCVSSLAASAAFRFRTRHAWILWWPLDVVC